MEMLIWILAQRKVLIKDTNLLITGMFRIRKALVWKGWTRKEDQKGEGSLEPSLTEGQINGQLMVEKDAAITVNEGWPES